MDAPATIENIPYEVLTEIMLLVGRGDKTLSIFCRLTQSLRNVALNTPALWTNLTTTCYVKRSFPIQIEAWYSEYISWWSDRVTQSNQFSLSFKLDISRTEKEKQWVALEGKPKAAIFKLISCARYLETYGTGLGSLARWASPEDPWRLQTIVLRPRKELWERGYNFLDGPAGIESFLSTFTLPALRKCSISDATRCPTLNAPGYETDLEHWGQITHLDITLEKTTLVDWRMFLVALRSLKRARIRVDVCEDEESETQPNNAFQHTIADLEELWLYIPCRHDPQRVLDGIHLPNLKTLIVDSPRLTVNCLHRLLQDTPLVQRIRVSAMFPATDTDLVAYPSTGESLMRYAPLLTRLVIAIPDLNKLQQSLTDYVDGMRQSRWLKGRNKGMRMVLPWSTGTDIRVENLQQSLCMHGITDVVVKSKWPPEGEELGVSLWDSVVDFEAEF
jgi:hypothetical protein